MPIYEYRCDSCGHELEVMQKLADAPLTDCPECETSALRKKISAVGFRLKGSGWYETDFKSGNKKNLAEGGSSEAKAGADSGTKSESKADGKTASKSEPKSGDKPSSSGKSSTSNAAA